MFRSCDYHPKWGLIRRMVLRRAAGRCEWCRAHDRRPHPRTSSRVHLAVAHLDRDRRHNSFWNLAALCQACHLAHDRPQHLLSRRAGRAWLAGLVPGQNYQLTLDLPDGPLHQAYRAGLVQLLPAARTSALAVVAAGRRQPRKQLALTYQPLMAISTPSISRAEVLRRQRLAIQLCTGPVALAESARSTGA